MKRLVVLFACVAAIVAPFLFSRAAFAQAKPAPALGKVTTDCQEIIANGATRPDVSEDFPDEGIAGYASQLVVTIRHGKGETVLPNGFKSSSQSLANRNLLNSGFAIPEATLLSIPKIETKNVGEYAVSKFSIPIVLLPQGAGKHVLTLPALPLTIARAGGDVMTVCTSTHTIDSLDPTQDETDPKVKPNPNARHQKEPWELLRLLLIIGFFAVIFLAIVAYVIVRQLRKPKPEKIIPKRVPWELALEELNGLRESKLLEEGKLGEYFDAVSDCVRKYLGSRYGFEELGFDGLDTTTDEMRALLKRVKPPIKNLDQIALFLNDCDLVKFARLLPNKEECVTTLEKGEAIVKGTTPNLVKPAQGPTVGQVATGAAVPAEGVASAAGPASSDAPDTQPTPPPAPPPAAAPPGSPPPQAPPDAGGGS